MPSKARLSHLSRRLALVALVWLPGSAPLHPAQLQVPGFAEITSPRPNEAVAGVITITGTADHPAFERFELAFGFDPDETETWFPIGEPVSTRVIDGRLALWDTIEISDGNYRLRLQVWLEDGQVLEAIVSGVRVRNYSPTETPANPLTGQEEFAPPWTPAATATPVAAPSVEPLGKPANPFSMSFVVGAGVATAVLGGLVVYRHVGAAIRAHLAYLRIRQVHRRLDRARRRARSR